MLTFCVTLYGENEHAEREEAQQLWGALERTHANRSIPLVAMLIGEARYSPPLTTNPEIKVE